MNIFYLSSNPIHAARYLHDKHVVKMILESAQLLSTYYHLQKGRDIPLHIQKQLCKPTHEKHPCQLWLHESTYNVAWLIEHAKELLALYTVIYKKIHKLDHLIHIIDRHLQPLRFNMDVIVAYHTPPPCCMPSEFVIDELKSSYRTKTAYVLYYYCKKMEWFSSATNKWYDNKWTGAMGESRFPNILTKDYLVNNVLAFYPDNKKAEVLRSLIIRKEPIQQEKDYGKRNVDTGMVSNEA